MVLVAGVDSSTQSCKVVIVDAVTGHVVRHGRASHPEGTEVHPDAWWAALRLALDEAGGIADVSAISVAGHQHGMVCLDARGDVVRPALLWNDTRSAGAAERLIADLGSGDRARGAAEWARRFGTVPVASLTVTKLAWLAEHEPENAARTAAVVLPHDWLSWKLSGSASLDDLVTDRSDASGTGYWSPGTGLYDDEMLAHALGHVPLVPRVLGPAESALRTPGGAMIGAGAGDNAAAALGLGASEGDVIVSIGTSGTAFAVSATPTADESGTVAGFADATGLFLPLVATLNAAQVLDQTAELLGVDHAGLSRLALEAGPGADGLTLLPYFAGERTPRLPYATGSLSGMTLRNFTPQNMARAAVEGVLCGLADGIDAITALGCPVTRVLLIGGGARSPAIRSIAPGIFGVPVVVPTPAEYAAMGAARQAAWVQGDGRLPSWRQEAGDQVTAARNSDLLAHYARARDRVIEQHRA